MLGPGSSRQQLAATLKAAYAEGLLSQRTLVQRLDLLFASRIVDPAWLVGDLPNRVPRRTGGTVVPRTRRALARLRRASGAAPQPILLALDWTGGQSELLIGRHHECDVVLHALTVSRRHARLVFRDGSWIVQDLDSTNGTEVNGVSVGRCRLHPGDRLALADQLLEVD